MIESVEDLKSGMVIRLRGRELFFVVVSEKFRSAYSIGENKNMNDYLDLTQHHEGLKCVVGSEYDVVEVYEPIAVSSLLNFCNASLKTKFELIYEEPTTFKCKKCDGIYTNEHSSHIDDMCKPCITEYEKALATVNDFEAVVEGIV